jgi:hypothetical protein
MFRRTITSPKQGVQGKGFLAGSVIQDNLNVTDRFFLIYNTAGQPHCHR